MDALARKVRFAFRQLWKSPGVAVTSVLILALGIGATTAIFSLVEGVLLRPLPYRDPDRLVVLGEHLGSNPGISVRIREISTYASASRAFASLGGSYGGSYELSGGARPEEINGARLTAGVFPTLGVPPMLGRTFTQAEEDAHQPLVVLSYALWVNRYQRDANIPGKTIVLDRKPYTITGVMPRGFEYPPSSGHLNQAQLWVPMSPSADELSEQSGLWGYRIVARLKDGISVGQAKQDADRVARQIMRDLPVTMAALRLRGDAMPLQEYVVADVRPLLRTLFMAAAIVLLMACANVAGLLLVRAIRRRREYAVRLALGAGSGVILQESVLEGMLLGMAGGVLGLALAAIAIRTTLHLLPESMPRIDSISVDGSVGAFAFLLALVTGALCSLAPAFVALRTNLTESLKEGDRSGSGAASHTWLRSVLVVSEIAIALVLLSSAGAFLRSFQKMRAVDPGFRPDHVLVAGFQLPVSQYPAQASSDAFNRTLVARLASQPGIVAAGITNALPASGNGPQSTYTIENEPVDGWKIKFAGFAFTYGDYFRAMGIPLIAGRYFTEADRSDAPLVMIVNQSMAEHSWPGQSALGKRLHVGNPKKGLPWATVVGVVADTKLGARDEPSIEQWYSPILQPAILYGTKPLGNTYGGGGGYIALRSALAPEEMVHVLRATVAEMDPLLPLQPVQTMDEAISNVEAPRRFNTTLITSFAFGALVLSLSGIYAVIAFSVSLRAQEIAIRMALGAERGNIARLVLVSAAKLTLLGCALGVVGAVAVARVISSFLFAVSAVDPAIYAASVFVMLLLGLVASAIPAARAAATDPMRALRAN